MPLESPNSINTELEFDPELVANDLQLQAFMQMRETGKIDFRLALPLAVKALLTDIPLAILRNWPGGVGMKLRQIYFKAKMRSLGQNVLIDTAVEVQKPERISISDFCFIDKYVSLNALGGGIDIGRRVHIAPYAIISGAGLGDNEGIFIGDYVGVGAFARIYSHSEAPIDGKRMSGPMIPERMKGMISAPVRIEKDGLIGTGAVILPDVQVGEGAIVAANSLVTSHTIIPPYTIYAGIPARRVGLRKKVNVPDI